MRQPSINSFQFVQGDPSSITPTADLVRYVQDLESRLAAALNLLASGHRDAVYSEPARARFGDEVLVGPGGWDPGAGEGVYRYSSTGQWIKLG